MSAYDLISYYIDRVRFVLIQFWIIDLTENKWCSNGVCRGKSKRFRMFVLFIDYTATFPPLIGTKYGHIRKSPISLWWKFYTKFILIPPSLWHGILEWNKNKSRSKWGMKLPQYWLFQYNIRWMCVDPFRREKYCVVWTCGTYVPFIDYTMIVFFCLFVFIPNGHRIGTHSQFPRFFVSTKVWCKILLSVPWKKNDGSKWDMKIPSYSFFLYNHCFCYSISGLG